jgi:protein-S-isoprenylcysteine O-methyltransferase Ste14
LILSVIPDSIEVLMKRHLCVHLPLILVLIVVTLALLAFDRPLARSDGLAYFLWLDSIAGDGDMDLSNQAEVFAHVNTYQIFYHEPTGQWASVFPHGTGLLLTPAYWLAAGVDRMGYLHVNDDHFVALQGRSLPYSLLAMLGVNLYALGMVTLVYLMARRFAPSWAAAVAAGVLFLGTPLLYYATVEPFSAHVPGAFLTTLSLYLLLRGEEAGSRVWCWWAAAGLASGMATLVRWQLSLFVVGSGLWLLLCRRWNGAVLFVLGFVALAWHVPYTWNWMFGSPWVVPAAERGQAGFLGWPLHIGDVLFSDARGLFVWSPLTLLGLVGLTSLGRKRWPLALMLIFLLQAVLNGMVADWWGGWSFGMRRMAELYPVFVLGLGALLGRRQVGRWLIPWWGQGVLVITVVLGLVFSLLLFLSHLNFINTVLEQPQGDRASTEICYQLTQSDFHVTWMVMKEHYGVWAWAWPGP